jgi:transposase
MIDNISELARELGVTRYQSYISGEKSMKSLTRKFSWERQFKTNARTGRITELKRKLKDAELERDILKKAIGIFPKRSMIYTFIKTMKRYFRLKRCKSIASWSKELLSMEKPVCFREKTKS